MKDKAQQNLTASKQSPVEHDAQPLAQDDLKEKFSEGHIPTQQDFSDLIDMASVGYAAVGMQSGGTPGWGLELDGSRRLAVKIDNQASESDAKGGLSISADGLSVAIDSSTGLQIDEKHRLAIDKDALLSVNAFGKLSKADLRAIYELLLNAYNSPFGPGKRLIASEVVDGDQFGQSVAVSRDGKTLLVGSYNGSEKAGAAYVFVKNNRGKWAEQPTLNAFKPVAGDCFGYSVAVSDDGQTLVVGAPDDITNATDGAVYVFEKNGMKWKLTGEEGGDTRFNCFGHSVAISADGKTLLVGTPSMGNGGRAYVFTRGDTNWDRSKLNFTLSGNLFSYCFGLGVAMSDDGKTLFVGTDYSKIHVFAKNGGEWEETILTVPSNYIEKFAVSGDGKTLLVGAHVFTKKGTEWDDAKDAKKLSFSEPNGDSDVNAVAASSDGQTLLVGPYVFSKVMGTWLERQKLATPDGVVDEGFGHSVAVSGNGETLLIGAFKKFSDSAQDDPYAAYAAYVYEPSV